MQPARSLFAGIPTIIFIFTILKMDHPANWRKTEKMKKQLLIIAGMFLSLATVAQETSSGLVTDRPDQTESAAVVPFKSLQIESGFVMEKSTIADITVNSYTYNTTLLRYGLFKPFELRLGLEYLGENTPGAPSGFGPLHTGFKVRIAREDGWKPAVAFLGGINLPFTADDYYAPENTAAGLRFAFAHTLSEKLSLGYNLGAEWVGESASPGFFYSVALGIGLTDHLSMFAESYGLVPESGIREHMLDAGFTYLLLHNLQVDASAGVGLNEEAADHFLSFGISYRIPE